MALLKPRNRKSATPPPPPTMSVSDIRILRLAEVSHRVGLKRARIYELIAEGRFPSQRKCGGASGWLESEISAWILANWQPVNGGIAQ
jgi:prophage regulatory protein